MLLPPLVDLSAISSSIAPAPALFSSVKIADFLRRRSSEPVLRISQGTAGPHRGMKTSSRRRPRATAADGTVFQIRFAWVLTNSLFREQPPKPPNAAAERAEQIKPKAAFPTLGISWC